jgi:hypothetical protein
MTMNLNLSECVNHELESGHSFFESRVPEELMWDDKRFNWEWIRHPAERHVVKMFGKWMETPRYQQAYGANYSYTGSRNNALAVPRSC